jgi:hypothetical protein
MTDATSDPGPVPGPVPGSGTGPGSVPGSGEAADRGAPPGHDRTVAPTPSEVAGPAAPDPGATADPGTPGLGATERRSAASPTGSADPADRHGTTRLLPHDECDKLELRLRNAVSGFVDGPRDAVEEADHVVEEIAGRFSEALTRRRRTLRMSWQDGEGKATRPDTEQLRLALRDYRELAERLLHG